MAGRISLHFFVFTMRMESRGPPILHSSNQGHVRNCREFAPPPPRVSISLMDIFATESSMMRLYDACDFALSLELGFDVTERTPKEL